MMTKRTIYLLFCLLLACGYGYGLSSLIDNPEELYTISTSDNSTLNSKISLKRTFYTIYDLIDELNSINGITAKVKDQSIVVPQPVSIYLDDEPITQLLEQSAKKLGYTWMVDNTQIIFSAIKPMPIKVVSKQIINKIQVLPQWSMNPSDQTLRNVLSKWCNTAKWQLIWNVKADYPIVTSWTIKDSFESAVNAVLKASQQTEVPIMAIMHDSNHVLEIYSPVVYR